MSETPGWLSPEGTDGAAAGPANSNGGGENTFEMTTGVTPEPTNGTASSSGGGGSATVVDDNDLPKMILTMRLANMGVAIALVACSILRMTTIPGPDTFVLAIYATCGGLLICCLETQLKFLRVIIAVNFGFLFNSVWRFMFYMLLSTVAWSYNNLFGKIVAGCMAGCAVFNTYVLCRYPSYRKIRERIAEEEDKRIESRISKEVKKQAVKQATGGAVNM